MTITVYELDGTVDVRFTPYCWRTLLALSHKEFNDIERGPVSFRDRSPIAFSNQERVPLPRRYCSTPFPQAPMMKRVK